MGSFKPNVEKMEKKRDVVGLIEALGHKDWVVRSNAARALGRIGDVGAVEPLIDAMKDDNEQVKDAAGEALQEIRDPGAVKPLIQALKDEQPYVRKGAAEALGKLGDSQAVEPLIQFLNDEARADLWQKLAQRYPRRAEREFADFCNSAIEALGSIGDLRAAEGVMNWLFEYASDYFPALGFKSLFGNYTDLIINASLKDPKSRGKSDEAIHELCGIRTQISNNILHKICQKEDYLAEKYVHSDIDHDYGISTETISFESQRDAARKELERRGNPPYNPSAYLNREAWKL